MKLDLRRRATSLVLAALSASLLIVSAACPSAAGPALLYDTEGDRVLYAEDADYPWYAASLTKMMTAYLVFETWKQGRATKDTKITISAKANAQPKMRLGLGAGKELTYDHAVKALIIVSANDIAHALAEAVSGDVDTFVAAMNAKAAALGMTATRFVNPHGLPGRGQHTTAQDMARLAAALMRDYPEHLEYFGLTTTEIGEKRKRMIATHNPVLVTFEGGDGFKTGFTCSAGYNIVASATRDGRRLVAVVLGEESSAKRAIKVNALLDYGFRMLAWKELFPAATIHSLPGGFYDRERIRAVNLEQRYKDCRDADPEESIALEVANAVAIAGTVALEGGASVAGAVTGAEAGVKTGTAAQAPSPKKTVATGAPGVPASGTAPVRTAPVRTAPVAAASKAPAPPSASAGTTSPVVKKAAAAAPTGVAPAAGAAPAAAAATAPQAKTAAVPAAKPAGASPAATAIAKPAPAPAQTAEPLAKPAAPAVAAAKPETAPASTAAKPSSKQTAKRKPKPAPSEGTGFSLASPF